MYGRRKGYQHESNRTADIDQYEKHTSTNRRIPNSTGQPSSSTKNNAPSVKEKKGVHANAPKFDPRVEAVAPRPGIKNAENTTEALLSTLSTSIGTPRVRPSESALNATSTTRKTTTTQNRATSFGEPQIRGSRAGDRTAAESRLRRLLTPHYPNSGPAIAPTSIRSSSASPIRNFRRDNSLYSSDRKYTRRDEKLLQSYNKDTGWQPPNITRKSILRHSIGIDNPRRYTETVDSSSSADSFSSDKRVRFQDQVRVKRKIVPSPELVQLVRTDSENSLTSSSSGNLHSNSEVSVSSGTGSLPDFQLVDYSLGSNSGSEGANPRSGESQGSTGRQTRQYSSNDSDYSTENESLYGIDKLRKNEPHYSSSDSIKSSAYSSSSSVKSSSYSKTDQSRPRVKSESSEDEPVQRHIKKINLKEIHVESDEDLKSDGSNSTLADSSSSESEIVLASGIVIKREKFTSGSEFESSAESTEGYPEADRKGSWFMTVKEHRASSPSNYDEEQVLEKEIFFKFKAKGHDVIEEEPAPEAQFISVENVELEEVKQVKRPTPRRPTPIKPVEMIVQTVSDSESERVLTVQEENVSQKSKTPQVTDLDSLKSVTVEEGEMDDLTEGSISLTHITTLEGSLTQTSMFTLPARDKHSPNLEEIKSAPESSESSSTKGVHAPYHLVKQIVKQNEALHLLQQQGKLNKLVSYSCSSLSSNGTEGSESLVSLVENPTSPSAFAPGYFYDAFGNKKRVMVSTGTSTVFGTEYSLENPYDTDLTGSTLKNDEAKQAFLDQRTTQTSFDTATVEIVLLDPHPLSWEKQKKLMSTAVQTDQDGSKRFSFQKQTSKDSEAQTTDQEGSKQFSFQKQTSNPSAFEEYSKSQTSTDFAERDTKDSEAQTTDTGNLITSIKAFTSESSHEPDKKENFVTLREVDTKPSIIIDVGRSSKTAANKRFAYKKEKKVVDSCGPLSDIDIATAGEGKFVEDFSISTSSGKDSVISFHECHEEIVSTSDLLESLSSNSSANDSPLSSDTEELRVSLKISRDLSKSDSNASGEGSDEDTSRWESTSGTISSIEIKARPAELSVNIKDSAEEVGPGKLVEYPANSSTGEGCDEDTSRLESTSGTISSTEIKARPAELSVNIKDIAEELGLGELIESPANSSKSNSSNSVQSADQRLIESILNEVEEMIIESKTCNTEQSPRENKDVADTDSSLSTDQVNVTDTAKSHEYSENASCYSVGEIVLEDSRKSGADHSTNSESIERPESAEKGGKKIANESAQADVDKYLLYLKDKSLSSSDSGSQVSINKSSDKAESDFEKLHREMKEMFDRRSHKTLTSRTTSNSTLGRIPSIKSSSSESLSSKHNAILSGSGLSIERESSTSDDRVRNRDQVHEDSDDEVIIETISDAMDGKSLTNSRFRRKSSYGAITISDPEGIPQPRKHSSSSKGKESDKLLKSPGSSKSKHRVPRLSTLSKSLRRRDASKPSKRDLQRESYEKSAGDGSDNKTSNKSSTGTSAYSSKLRASSGKPGLGGGLVDYELTTGLSATLVSSEDELSADELDDLVYSLKMSRPSEGEDVEMFCENCRSDKCSCESSNTITNSEMTDSSRYRRGRWQENYGVLRALKWVFCPCRDA